jgi:hypothetical protein
MSWKWLGRVLFGIAAAMDALSGTDPIRPLSGLRFDRTTFDGDAYFIQNASYANEVLAV